MSHPSRVVRGLTVAGLTLSASLAFASAAVAAPSPAAPITASAMSLSFSPAKGADITPMYLVVPKGCPAAATNVVASAVGHGFPADGQTVIGNTSAGINHKTAFVLPLQDTFEAFAAANGTVLSGPYKVSLRCIDSLGATTYAAFTATVTFSAPHQFTAPATPASVIAAIAASQNPNQDVSPAPTAAATSAVPRASSAGQAPQSSASASAAARGSALSAGTPSTKPTSASHSAATSWEPWLVVGALLLIVGAVLMRARELRQGRRREAAKAAERATKSAPDLTSADR